MLFSHHLSSCFSKMSCVCLFLCCCVDGYIDEARLRVCAVGLLPYAYSRLNLHVDTQAGMFRHRSRHALRNCAQSGSCRATKSQNAVEWFICTV